MSSYHDVSVYVGNVRYVPANNYALQLHCTKAAGWELWRIWQGEEQLIGGEYDREPFCITVGDMVILGAKPETVEDPNAFGWDGSVNVSDAGVTFGPVAPNVDTDVPR